MNHISPAVKFLQGDAENLPVRDGLIDIALVNGLFNLNLFRERIFFELNRVLRTNGKIFAAELIIQEDLPQSITESETDWFR